MPEESEAVVAPAWMARTRPWLELAVAIVALYNSGRQALRVFDGRDLETSGVVLSIVLTALAVIIAAYIFRVDKDQFTRGFALGAGSVAIAGVVFLLVALAMIRDKDVDIDVPSGGETISRIEMVQGTFQKVPDAESIWIAVVPLGVEEYRYHPQGPATKLSGGKWQATAFIGMDSPEDEGREFDIHALLADERGEEKILEYLDTAQASGSYPGLLGLPPGAVSYDQVRVIRGVAPSATRAPGRCTVTIEEPQDGESVERETTVSGQYSCVEPSEPPSLHVLVKPLPGNPEIPWFVQDPATLDADGAWFNQSLVGLPDDAPGTPFSICAVITDEELEPGQELHDLPEGPSDCVGVTRAGPITPAPTGDSTTTSPTPPTRPRILAPAGGEAVPMVITVEFESPEPAYVLVRPKPDDPDQDYWVQAEATSTGPNRWKSHPVNVGQESDPSGLPFKVCVVITDHTLDADQNLRRLPEGPSHCVDVTRGESVPPAPTPSSTPTASPTPQARIPLEAEAGSGEGLIKPRSAASGQRTVWLHSGESRTLSFRLATGARYGLSVRYSNDNFGPLETVAVSVNGAKVGQFAALDTGDFGSGWNVFRSSGTIGWLHLQAGVHEVNVSVTGGDGFGVEIDLVALNRTE